ncbi:MAG: oligosaccharide flippase family protein [Deltaproteobacteria bacterium]|nr:oligosaccharide flippase family protein [Deltaproteobacteria bacterium]
MGESTDLPHIEDRSISEGGHGGHLAVGTAQGFIASAISLPTGIMTAAFLTRQLGPVNYGLLTVAAAIVVWIEGTITVGFSRAAVKFIAEAKDWQPVATKFLQAQVLVSLGITVLLFASAPAIASWLDAGEMSTYLRVYSLGIPISALCAIHRSVLTGRGYFGKRAVLPATYWVSRMLLVFLFVGLYPSVTYVILANIGASVVMLCCARVFVRPVLLEKSDFPFSKLWDYAWPLFFYTVGINLFSRLDLFFVKAMSGIPQAAGYFGAAKNLTIVPVLFAVSFSPLLLSKLTHLCAKGSREDAQNMARQAMRLVVCLLPFAGMAAGCASEVVPAIYGDLFVPAAPLLAILIFAAVGMVMVSVATSILIASGRPGLPVILMLPLVGMTPPAHFIFVPWFGPVGAAAVTTGFAWLGAGTMILAVYRVWHVLPSVGTVVRNFLVCLFAYTIAFQWPAQGVMLIVKLPVIGLINVLALLLLGEFTRKEAGFVFAKIRKLRTSV